MDSKIKEYKITKVFGRKISANYGNGVDVSTVLSTTVRVSNAEELKQESDKVFAQVRELTLTDIENNREIIKNALRPGEEQNI